MHKRYTPDPKQLNQQRFKCAAQMREPLYNPNAINTKSASITVTLELPELILYQELLKKYAPISLYHQLLFMMDSSRRREAELYITERAKIAGYQALNQANLPVASNLVIANIYLYFQLRDDTE